MADAAFMIDFCNQINRESVASSSLNLTCAVNDVTAKATISGDEVVSFESAPSTSDVSTRSRTSARKLIHCRI